MGQEQKGFTLWLTGLSGSGKTTLSHALSTELKALGYNKVEILDGDSVRRHLSSELGFSQSDRETNIRRIGFVAQLLTRNDIIVIVAAISPDLALRTEIRQLIGRFFEVFVNAPLTTCEQRDPKGLYRKARAGLLANFTGIDAPYDPPLHPDIECRTDLESVQQSTAKVLAKLKERGYLDRSGDLTID